MNNNRYTTTPCKNPPDGTWVILLYLVHSHRILALFTVFYAILIILYLDFKVNLFL